MLADVLPFHPLAPKLDDFGIFFWRPFGLFLGRRLCRMRSGLSFCRDCAGGRQRGGSAVAGAMVVGGTDAERVVGGPRGRAEGVSSSLGLRRREISTLPECEREYTGKGRGCC